MPGRSLPTEVNLGLVGLAVPSSLIPGVDQQLVKCNPSNPIRTRNKSFETSFYLLK